MRRSRKRGGPLPVLKKAKAPLYQCGIEPDELDARDWVEAALGWKFVDQIDDGVWNVTLPHPLPEGACVDLTLTAGDDELWGGEVKLTIEWP